MCAENGEKLWGCVPSQPNAGQGERCAKIRDPEFLPNASRFQDPQRALAVCVRGLSGLRPCQKKAPVAIRRAAKRSQCARRSIPVGKRAFRLEWDNVLRTNRPLF